MKPRLASVAKLIDDMRSLYAENHQETILWSKIQEAMLPVLADPELMIRSREWPETVFGAPRVRNLLFYVDPDYGFAFNATVRKPDLVTSVHDHGDVWTLYGIIEGRETMYRYERTDDGPRDLGPASLRVIASYEIGPGDIDVVPPGMIHQEHAGPVVSTAFIVRGRKPGTFPQRLYEPKTGGIEIMNGPELVPYQL
jgi:predicted metal-dependent enzyme (double-stranded beta helix superfamily)